MNPMKRRGLVVLVLILGGLFAASPALARKEAKPSYWTFALTPPEIEPPEPQASGNCTLTTYPALPLAGTGVDLSGKLLTPGKQYLVVIFVEWYEPYEFGEWGNWGSWWESHTATADSKGRLNAQFTVEDPLGRSYVYVRDLWIENNAGDVVLEVKWE